jgi:cbb3-type cytochrome oxidase subunit 3
MNFGAIATLLVAGAFVGLLFWVLRPANKARLESYGSIPLDDEDHPNDRNSRSR